MRRMSANSFLNTLCARLPEGEGRQIAGSFFEGASSFPPLDRLFLVYLGIMPSFPR